MIVRPENTYYDVCLIISDLTNISFARVHRVCLDVE